MSQTMEVLLFRHIENIYKRIITLQMEIDKEKCIECGKCARACPRQAITCNDKIKCNRLQRRGWKIIAIIIIALLIYEMMA